MSLPQGRPAPAKGSPWTLRVATVADIPVRLHVTFLLFLAWLGAVNGARGLFLVVGLFVCVVLHEFGHALTARRYGIATRDITLYPIGGVAMLSGRLRPRHELWVALAGPAVNVVLAAILWTATRLFGATPLVEGLLTANVVMAAFNMIPAFPMDGGRVLRAILARAMPETKATAIAANVGQALAMGLFLYGVLHSMSILCLVAFFVFLGAGQEGQAEATRTALSGHRAREAMQTRFRTLPHGTSLETAAEALLADSQTDFPIVANDEVVGLMTRRDLATGLAVHGPDAYVAGSMTRETKVTTPDAALEDVIELLTREDPSPVLVMEEGRLVGMVTTENVGEFLMLEHARRRARML